MARESTFPTQDVPDRSNEVLSILERHDPVPVPMTTVYLMVEDKRALAEEFHRLEDEGRIQRAVVMPGEPDYQKVFELTQGQDKATPGPIGVYRLAR
jgi:hypothetical protein